MGDDPAPSDVPLQAFRQFCYRAGYEPVKAFVRANGSAAYSQLVELLRQDDDKLTVVVPALDVFGAKIENIAIALFELEYLGAEVLVMDGGVVDPVSVVIAEWAKLSEGNDIRERIKSAMRKRAIRGEGLGKPPYGYLIGKSRKLEVLPGEADTVRLIFSLYTQKGLGIRRIVRHLNENGIRTRKDRNWSMVTIRDILRNRAYLGTYTRFGMRVAGVHAALITPDMFRWAQNKLDERRPKRSNVQAEPFLLSGMIYCGYCENRMVGVTRKQSWTRRKDGTRAEKQYRYYQCQSRTNQSVCQYHTRRAHDLEQSVLDHLRSHRAKIAAMKGRRSASGNSAIQRERQRLEASRKGAERRMRQHLQQLASGDVNAEGFRSATEQILTARLDVIEQMAVLDRHELEQANGLTPGQQAASVIDRLAAGWDGMGHKEKRPLLQQVVDRINVLDDRAEVKVRVL